MTAAHARRRWGAPRLLTGLAALLLAGCGGDRQQPGAPAPQPWLDPPSFVRELSGGGGLMVRYLSGVAVSSTGTLWVTQATPPRLWNFDVDGRVLARIDFADRPDPQPYWRPRAVAPAPDGTLWMLDQSLDRLHHLSARGELLLSVGDDTDPQGRFGDPVALAVGPAGEVYVLDAYNFRVVAFGPDGARRGAFGRRCAGDCGFEDPQGLAVAPGGDLLVLDYDDARVKRYHPDGTFAGSWGEAGEANADGELAGPIALSTAADGLIDILDGGGTRIQRFTPEGVFVSAIPVDVRCWPGESRTGLVGPVVRGAGGEYFAIDQCRLHVQRVNAQGRTVTAFSGGDPDAFTLGSVSQAVADARGHVFTLDYNRGGVMETDAAGALVRDWGPPESASGSYYTSIRRIALDSRGRLYRVRSYDGRVLRTPGAGGVTDTLDLKLPRDYGAPRAAALAVDDAGRLFVSLESGPIRAYDAEGRLLADWLLPPPTVRPGQVPRYGAAEDLQVAADGSLWALDSVYPRIVRYDAAGQLLDIIPFAAEGPEAVRVPRALALAPDGRFDVLNSSNGRIYRFSAEGRFLFRWTRGSELPGGLCGPASISWDAAGRFYVVDAACGRVNVYRY